MILYRGLFALEVYKLNVTSVGYYRPATVDRLWQPDVDDYVVETLGDIESNDENRDSVLVISSLSDVRKACRGRLIITILLAIGFSIAAIRSAAIASVNFQLEGMKIWTFAWTAIFAFLAIVYNSQAINPMVHDLENKWINLRTGSSNLNGGCKLYSKRKLRKRKKVVYDASDI